MKQLNLIILIIFALVLSSLACNFGFGRPATPENDVPLATEALSIPGVNQADPNPGTGIQDLEPIIVTEAELTALMEDELQQRIGDQISNLQVDLRSGQIQILGDVNTQGIAAPVKVVIDVSIDPVGRPTLSIISSNIGPFPVPGDLIAELEVLINKAFQEKVIALAPNMHIDDIVIQNGVMTIYGHSR
ncbi:MAG: hypothetical protein JJE12_00040 [Anaerolineales bacterium]|nr:hypothetical protein [Anaerolineales bacterium]